MKNNNIERLSIENFNFGNKNKDNYENFKFMFNKINKFDLEYNILEFIYNEYNKKKLVEYLDGKKFRIQQIKDWVFKKYQFDFNRMSNIPNKIREFLKNYFNIVTLKVETILNEEKSETYKFGLKTFDGNIIEMVILTDDRKNNDFKDKNSKNNKKNINEKNNKKNNKNSESKKNVKSNKNEKNFERTKKRYTLCISSQIGCPVGCKFCATGQSGYLRNLSYIEIVSQFLIAEYFLKTTINSKARVDNIVYMGMGEPLLNLKNVLKSIDILSDEKGRCFSPKRITISTVGIINGLKELLNYNRNFKIAFSLHTPFNEQRKELIPYNQNLDKTIKLLKLYREKTKKRIGIEYILFDKVNDSKKHIEKLIPIIKELGNYINLIEYNPVEGIDFKSPDREQVHFIKKELEKYKINVSIRYKRGKAIDGACGQLRWKKIKKD